MWFRPIVPACRSCETCALEEGRQRDGAQGVKEVWRTSVGKEMRMQIVKNYKSAIGFNMFIESYAHLINMRLINAYRYQVWLVLGLGL